ncbi:MAG: ATP-binding domain-containing protein [Iamia sp.]
MPFAYADELHLAHGYAMTIHKAQGATTDHALVLVDDGTSREAIYTAMSRGRQRNVLFIATDETRAEIAHAPRDRLRSGGCSPGQHGPQHRPADGRRQARTGQVSCILRLELRRTSTI